MIKENQKFLNGMMIAVDGLVICISLILSYFIRFYVNIFNTNQIRLSFKEYLMPLIIILPLYYILYNVYNLYSPHRRKSLDSEINSLIKINIIGLGILMSMFYIFKNVHYSRYVLLIFSIINTINSSLERYFIRRTLREIRSKGYNLKHVLIIGAGELGCNFAKKINDNKYLGYNIIGFLDDNKQPGYKVSKSHILGSIDELSHIIMKRNIDEIMIALPLGEYGKLGAIISTCEKYGVKAQIIPDYYKYIPAKPYVDVIDDLAIINIRHVPLDFPFNRLIKRILDVILSSIGIIILSPLLITIATGVKLSSPGPILFKQERVGLHRRNFNMYKFRSMKVQTHEDEKVKWTIKEDPRKTKFGSFIRKTSIDELPQLFNVLKGDMSLIGPRPERPYFVEKFREEIPKYMIKHHVRPGITGWAQVNGWRGDTSIKERIKCDLYYIENWNLWLDIKIIFLTIWKGFVNKNAY
ncbi:undecaprenyl-phosphate glucose phosphotransferase [Anaeromicrobium sediminis]|uniref:Undecaprenyl-phosphate glucose phosphotransferase n=1 Tax=Anaeromicrobium sediminis TaxID=1478221 RepID=A0A267MFA6_9FIRM|nr:undecaprenyl-phosphate glucose phosphotransferase [Anaeromicrobium sediminis]PAB58264.1 undecaprenyl-phosphate glucose phosphotransferase [Anaeromicrobium sediminis]